MKFKKGSVKKAEEVIQKKPKPIPEIEFSAERAKAKMLVAEAERWIGIKEGPKDNSGQMVERFQKAVDGKAVGEPWCMSFAQFCIKAVDELCERTEIPSLSDRSPLIKTEHCMTLWNKTPAHLRSNKPKAGYLVIWQKRNQHGRPTSQGHVGIVTEVINATTFRTVEGNTGGGHGVNRDGDGVFPKLRSVNGAGSMFVKGFIKVW